MNGILPYLILCFLLLSLAYFYTHVGKQQQKRINIVCFVLLTLFFGLHGEMGNDWQNYCFIYENDTWLNLLDFFRNPFSTKMMEPGFVTLLMICRSIGLPFQGFIFIIAVITNVLLYRFLIQHEANIPLSLFLILCFGGIELEINFLRSAIALLLFLNSIAFIASRRPVAFVLMNLLGICFHVSALLYLPCYFLYKLRISARWYVSISLFCFILYVAHIPLATFGVYIIDWALGNNEQMSSFQLIGSENIRTIPLGVIERVLTLLAVMTNKNKIESRGLCMNFFVNSYLVYFFFAFFLWDIPIVNNRFALMFIYGYWILWPTLPEFIKSNWQKWIVIAIMIIYCLLRILSIITQPIFSYTLFW